MELLLSWRWFCISQSKTRSVFFNGAFGDDEECIVVCCFGGGGGDGSFFIDSNWSSSVIKFGRIATSVGCMVGMMVDKSLSFSDLIDRERWEDLIECSLFDEDFFPDDALILFVKDLESFFEDFFKGFVEWGFW